MGLSAAERRYQALTVIACVSLVGLSLGLSIPLVSLTLEYRGYDSALIGVMAAMPALGILLLAPFMPALVARLSARRALPVAALIAGSAILVLPFIDAFGVWLLLRFVMGGADALLFVVSETWINQIADERNRGRLVALYITVLSLCYGSGPLLLAVTGSQGALPYLAAGGICYCAALPVLLGNAQPPAVEGKAGFGVLGFARIAPTLCAAVLLFALLDSSAAGMLPLFGLRHGFSEATAAMMISVAIAGSIVFQYPIGWLADRVSRSLLLLACGCGILLSGLSIPFLVSVPTLLGLALLLLGAAGGGAYTVSLVLIGQRFKGSDLVTANAAVGVLWGIGGLAGPPLAGVGMRLWNPNGLPLTWALAAGLFLALFMYRRSWKA